MDTHSRHFHERQAELLIRFRAIQERLLSGYEATATQARAGVARGELFAADRLIWAERAVEELRERMARNG